MKKIETIWVEGDVYVQQTTLEDKKAIKLHLLEKFDLPHPNPNFCLLMIKHQDNVIKQANRPPKR